jgi:hypothetical protein
MEFSTATTMTLGETLTASIITKLVPSAALCGSFSRTK